MSEKGTRFLSSPKRPRRFRGTSKPSIQWLACDFAPAMKQAARKAITHLMPWLRKRGAMPPLPKRLHGAILQHKFKF